MPSPTGLQGSSVWPQAEAKRNGSNHTRYFKTQKEFFKVNVKCDLTCIRGIKNVRTDSFRSNVNGSGRGFTDTLETRALCLCYM